MSGENTKLGNYLKNKMTGENTTLGDYLFTRFKQLGVNSIFGVPGDFTLTLLDHVDNVDGLDWVGNANELNAAYAADGYSRVKRLACLVTTFGVGELSALNGVAGAYAEHIGLVHVVGIPSTSAQRQRLLLHHTLGNGDFEVFSKMSEHISEKTITIKDDTKVAEDIDRAIREAYVTQRPVYLAVPSDMFETPVEKKLLDTPIDLSIEPNNKEDEQEVIESILELVSKAEKPIILVDACAERHGCVEEVNKLADKLQWPVFVTPMGKSVYDERNERFGGVYVGQLSEPEVSEVVENSDLVFSMGALLSDFNTGSFTYQYSTRNVVEFHSDHMKVKAADYPKIRMKELMNNLTPKLKQGKPFQHVPKIKEVATPAPKDSKLNQHYMWTRLSSWLRPGDVIVTETGCANFGIIQTKFPKNTLGISQVLWGSIGYSVGAAMGASKASCEDDETKRVILFVGDGSLQLTVQEISTMVKWGLKPYIFVLNNNGYTIEKLIHGENAKYNQIQPWKHLKILDLFSCEDYETKTVGTIGELDNMFEDKKFAEPERIRMIELMLPTMDAPESLIKQAKITAQTNG